MGYRLNIDIVTSKNNNEKEYKHIFYGTKFFGYVDNYEKYNSYKFLYDIASKKILNFVETSTFEYGINDPFFDKLFLDKKELRDFLILYLEDIAHYQKLNNGSYINNDEIMNIINEDFSRDINNCDLFYLYWN